MKQNWQESKKQQKMGKGGKLVYYRLNPGLFLVWPFPETLTTVASAAPGEMLIFLMHASKVFLLFAKSSRLSSFQYSSLFTVPLNTATVERAKIQDCLFCKQIPDFTASSKAVCNT